MVACFRILYYSLCNHYNMLCLASKALCNYQRLFSYVSNDTVDSILQYYLST